MVSSITIQKTDTFKRYKDLSIERLAQGKPLGVICEYCQTPAKNDAEKCNKCGAEIPKNYGLCFGVPIESVDDYLELLAFNGYCENK